MVGGFAQWLRAGGAVRRGARGLGIWVPVGKRDRDDARRRVMPFNRPRFILGTVFNIAQTDVVEVAAAVAV